MLRSSICIIIMDLPALRTVPFLHGNALAPASESILANGLTRTDNVLVYGLRPVCWPMASASRPAGDESILSRDRDGQTSEWIVNGTDKVKYNAPVAGCAAHSLRGVIITSETVMTGRSVGVQLNAQCKQRKRPSGPKAVQCGCGPSGEDSV